MKKLRKEKNMAKKDLRRARRLAGNEEAVRELSVKFHTLLRLHSKEKKASMKTRMNLEAFKARSECQRSFWRFASKLFSEDDSSTPLLLTKNQQNHTSHTCTALPQLVH